MENAKTPEQVAQELADVSKKAEEAQKRNEEMQRKLNEVATENATLRKRQEDISSEEVVRAQQVEAAQVSQEAQDIVTELSGDPVKAAAKLAALMNKTKSDAARNAVNEFLPKVEDYINKKEYMNKMRTDHPEYKEIEHLMTPAIEAKIRNKKMTLEKAMEETMNEFQPFINKNQPATTGASGFTGANPIQQSNPASAEPKVIYRDFKEHSTIETISEIEERKAWQKGKHITKKP